jgi:hypothetical protein
MVREDGREGFVNAVASPTSSFVFRIDGSLRPKLQTGAEVTG